MAYRTVTRVIGRVLKDHYAAINPEVLQVACARGTRIHGLCLNYTQGLVFGADPQDEGYFKSFTEWYDQAVIETLAVEPELESAALGVVGHPDLIVKLRHPESIAVVDLKTPVNAESWWKLQLAAYKYLAMSNGYAIERVGSLRVDAKGKPAKMKWYMEQSLKDFEAFQSMINFLSYLPKEKGEK
jgi:hypothetical protein